MATSLPTALPAHWQVITPLAERVESRHSLRQHDPRSSHRPRPASLDRCTPIGGNNPSCQMLNRQDQGYNRPQRDGAVIEVRKPNGSKVRRAVNSSSSQFCSRSECQQCGLPLQHGSTISSDRCAPTLPVNPTLSPELCKCGSLRFAAFGADRSKAGSSPGRLNGRFR